MELDKMSFKEKDLMLKVIVREFQKAQMQLSMIESKEQYPNINYGQVKENSSYYYLESSLLNSIEKKESLSTLIEFMENIIKSLQVDQYRMFFNEYLVPKNRDWWMEFYSRSTYYRLRKKTIDDVLFYVLK